MAEVEEPRFNSLADRIAALKRNQQADAGSATATATGGNSASVPKKRPPPPPPPPYSATTPTTSSPPLPSRPGLVPPAPRRTSTSPDPAPSSTPLSAPPPPPPRPALPNRNSSVGLVSATPSPALPPRRPSVQSLGESAHAYANGRRNSASSELSTVSSLSFGQASSTTSYASSNGTARNLPPPLEEASLPPLPPTKREREQQAREKNENGTASAAAAREKTAVPASRPMPATPLPTPPTRPCLPPRLPSRPARSFSAKPSEPSRPSTPAAATTTTKTSASIPTPPPTAPRRLPPPPSAFTKSPFSHGHQSTTPVDPSSPPQPSRNEPPALPKISRDLQEPPPPVPLASRPSEAQIEASVARLAVQHTCLTCRDFSGPDAVAAQYPRHTLPRYGVIDFLAHALCDPFPSATDKARAIFTWFHHNIAYDCAGFFNQSIRHFGPEETIANGVAVCAGYASTYQKIAEAAGLECVVVSGHGKGVSFTPMKRGDPVPPRNVDGHAWNAVRIDGGEWKLIDACWGAGNVSNVTQQFTRAFKSGEFTTPNDAFGLKHYPADPSYFFRRDGRVPTWEEYVTGANGGVAPPTVFGNAHQEGILAASIGPAEGEISVASAGVVRFQFSLLCEHWRPERHGNGPPVLFALGITNRNGQKEKVPLQTDGYWFWLDIHGQDLGLPGDTVSIVALTMFDDASARGITAERYKAKAGRVSASWSGVAKWQLV